MFQFLFFYFFVQPKNWIHKIDKTQKRLFGWNTNEIRLFLPWQGFGLWPHDHDGVVVLCFVTVHLYQRVRPDGVADVRGVMMLDYVDGATALTDPIVFDATMHHSCLVVVSRHNGNGNGNSHTISLMKIKINKWPAYASHIFRITFLAQKSVTAGRKVWNVQTPPKKSNNRSNSNFRWNKLLSSIFIHVGANGRFPNFDRLQYSLPYARSVRKSKMIESKQRTSGKYWIV